LIRSFDPTTQTETNDNYNNVFDNDGVLICLKPHHANNNNNIIKTPLKLSIRYYFTHIMIQKVRNTIKNN